MSTPRYDPTAERRDRAMQFLNHGAAIDRPMSTRVDRERPTHDPTPIPDWLQTLRDDSKRLVDGRPVKEIVERLVEGERRFADETFGRNHR